MASAQMVLAGEVVKKGNSSNLPNMGALTIQQVAELLQVSPRVVYQMINEGQIRCVRAGKRVRIPVDAYHEFLSGRPVNSGSAIPA